MAPVDGQRPPDAKHLCWCQVRPHGTRTLAAQARWGCPEGDAQRGSPLALQPPTPAPGVFGIEHLSGPRDSVRSPRLCVTSPGGHLGVSWIKQRPSLSSGQDGCAHGHKGMWSLCQPHLSGAEAFRKSGRWLLWLSLSRPQAWACLCPQARHQPQLASPSGQGQEQTEMTNTHTQSPRLLVFLTM